MKVLFLNPPQVFSKTQVNANVTPPLGLLYLASSIREKGHEVDLIDATVERADRITDLKNDISIRGLTFSEIVDKVDEQTDLIGISNLFSLTFPVVIELIDNLKNAFPDIKIVLGGAHPSALPKLCLEKSKADFIIIGEGELSFADLINCLENSASVDGIDGIAFEHNNEIVVNPKTNYIRDLDGLPFPARDLLNLEKYYSTHEAHGPSQGAWTPILSSRGCPFKCTFCTSKLWNRRFRTRSAQNVVEEIEHCIEEYGITEFHFEDENMTLKNERVREMCRLIIDKGVKIKWQTPNGIRAGDTACDTLDIMKQSGCCHITVAPESGSERVLKDIIHKEQDLESVTRIVKHASKIGLKTAAFFIIGLPGETIYDVKLSIKYASQLAVAGLDEVGISLFIPLPGSELYDMLLKQGKLNNDWASYATIGDMSKAVSWSEEISDSELNRLRKRAYLEFVLIKSVFHPLRVLKIFFNIIRKKEELKTERTLIAFIKRFRQQV
jgi:magnesium-protoporphyrin IX monomethyl ester (oxidative) cyclase